MADLRLAPGFHEALKARMATPEGKEAMNSLVDLIVETVVKTMPPEFLVSLNTPEGSKAFKELWPEIVDVYFRGLSNPNPKKIAGFPTYRQERIHAGAKELMAEELTLRQLLKAHEKTQVALAHKLNIGQDTVSRYERQADLLLSTLQRYVEAVDGKLSLLVEFPDRKPVKIGGFGELSDDPRQRA